MKTFSSFSFFISKYCKKHNVTYVIYLTIYWEFYNALDINIENPKGKHERDNVPCKVLTILKPVQSSTINKAT